MGRRVEENARRDRRFRLAGAFDVRGSGRAALARELPRALKDADAVIDFTCPEASAELAGWCAKAGTPLVIGTTGFGPRELARVKKAARKVPILLSPNMSPAVNLAIAAARLMAERLPGFDIHISESHHKAKKDAPSGTALRFKSRIAEVRRDPIPVTSVRAGTIVGEHTVLYAGEHEILELTHRAQSRDVFAAGALRAALWLKGRRPGLYDYFDLLDLK